MRVLLYGLAVSMSLFTVTSEAQFALGTHYVQLPARQPVATGDKIEVREFFWYGCPHCYRLEPYLDRWLERLPDDVAYVRTPGVARRWLPHARAYFAFQALGVTDKVHRAFFDAIHKEGKKLADEASIAEFLAPYGVDAAAFRKAFNSFGVKTQVQKAKQLNFRYGVDSVPTITVDGLYKTSVPQAGGPNQLIQLLDHLIAKARAERAANKRAAR